MLLCAWNNNPPFSPSVERDKCFFLWFAFTDGSIVASPTAFEKVWSSLRTEASQVMLYEAALLQFSVFSFFKYKLHSHWQIAHYWLPHATHYYAGAPGAAILFRYCDNNKNTLQPPYGLTYAQQASTTQQQYRPSQFLLIFKNSCLYTKQWHPISFWLPFFLLSLSAGLAFYC
jgi:hypothetical protein